MELAIVSLSTVLALVIPKYQVPIQQPTTNVDSLIVGALKISKKTFPDRTKETAHARQLDVERELFRLENIKQQEIAKNVQKAPVVSPSVVSGGTMDEKVMKLKLCESGNNYASRSNPKYRGAYQYDFSTWNNFGGYSDPADAPPEVQDAKFAETYARRGGSPWPVCSKKAGL